MSFDPRHILQHAEEFRRAAIRLEGNQETGEPFDIHTEVPMATLFAFSFELYLKFLVLIRTGNQANGTHDLRELFDLLPADVADRIRSMWENPTPIEASIRAAMAGHRQKHLSFDETLDESAKAFVKLRYSYQYLGRELPFTAGDIMAATRRVIYELYPHEFADIRLSLPAGALNSAAQSVVRHAIKPPLPKKRG